jgi:bifunctional non-homologous end joining protein LigD
LTYFIFDLLSLDGKDLTILPLVERKAELEKLVTGSQVGGRVRYSEHIEGGGSAFFREACRSGLEGIVSKRAQSTYRSGRRGDWVKVKCTKRQELVIGGWRPSTASSRELGSLLVGYYSRGKLKYAGRVGTGFSLRLGRELVRLLERHRREVSSFVEVPSADARQARWVKPDLVAEVEFTEWTREGYIRHPSFKGLRFDKPAKLVRHER